MRRTALLATGVLIVLVGVFPAVANAAYPAAAPARGASGGNHGHGGGGGGGSSPVCGSGGTTNCGFDISYPQCGTTLPSPTAFAIVGVNGGLANDYNPCLASELTWAGSSSGATSQPKVSLYVNTADPGNTYNGQPIADWPTTSLSGDQYGSCATTTVRSRGQTYTVGENSTACAWQYGYNMAEGDVTQFASPSSYRVWWLDVETANSWQTSTAMNVADLQGMIAAFQAAGVTTVGAYSTSAQWSTITGGSAAGSLHGIPNWIPGATSESAAQSNCNLPSFTGGKVTLAQWSGTIDSDYVCPA